MRRTRSRRGGRPLVPLRWTGDSSVAEQGVAAGATSTVALVVPADYEQQATMEAGGVTLIRVRMTVVLRAITLGAFCHMAVYVIGAAETVPLPSALAGLITGDTLWFTTRMLSVADPQWVEVDIKSKRRLENDQVVFAISAIGQNLNYALSARCLIRGG